MENGKVRNLTDSRLKVISRSEQPAAAASTFGPPKPRLLDQVRQAIRTRHYSYMTEKAYVSWIKRFIFFHNKRHPAEMGEAEIAAFLSSLASESKVGDRLYLTTLTRTSKNELIGFTTPNTSALAMNVASSAARLAVELKGQFSYKSGLSPWGTSKSIASDQNDLLFSFFESCLVCVTFSFQALEAFCNYSISRTWRKPVEVKQRKKKETLHHEAAEREISTEHKLKSILPKISDVPTPAGKAVWEQFIKLKRARDACVHIKYHDQYPLWQIDQESLFFQFLDNDPLSFPEVAAEMIAYFYSKQEQPRWLQLLPPLRSNRRLQDDAPPSART